MNIYFFCSSWVLRDVWLNPLGTPWTHTQGELHWCHYTTCQAATAAAAAAEALGVSQVEAAPTCAIPAPSPQFYICISFGWICKNLSKLAVPFKHRNYKPYVVQMFCRNIVRQGVSLYPFVQGDGKTQIFSHCMTLSYSLLHYYLVSL